MAGFLDRLMAAGAPGYAQQVQAQTPAPSGPSFFSRMADKWNAPWTAREAEWMAQRGQLAAPAPARDPFSGPVQRAFSLAPDGSATATAGLFPGRPAGVPNPGPVPAPRQIPLAAVLELMKVMPRPRVPSIGEQVYGQVAGSIQQQLANAKDPNEIKRLQSQWYDLGITGVRGNPQSASLAELLRLGGQQ